MKCPNCGHCMSETKTLTVNQEELLNEFPNATQEDLKDFILYWTEKSPNGRKQRWEKQKTFDPMRRWRTWMKNKGKFGKDDYQPIKTF